MSKKLTSQAQTQYSYLKWFFKLLFPSSYDTELYNSKSYNLKSANVKNKFCTIKVCLKYVKTKSIFMK